MPKYANRAGNSGVASFEIGPTWITVTFLDGGKYKYTDVSAGRSNIRRMAELAHKGRGLNTFINQHVKKRYASKLR